MPATLNAFNKEQITFARYGLQSQIYTFGPISLPTGQTVVFNVQNWNPSSSIDKVCILESLATSPPDPLVQIQWVADGNQSDTAQGWTDGFPTGTRALPVFAVAGSNLRLVINNMRVTPLASFQLNYGVTVMSYNLFQRLLQGFAPNAADQTALASLQSDENAKAAQRGTTPQNLTNEVSRLLASGSRPFSLGSMLTNLFENRRVTSPTESIPFHLVIATGMTESPTKTISVPSGLVYILRGISLEGANAGLTMNIDRDDDTALVNQLNAPAFAQADDLPWPFFLPANNYFGVTLNGNPGTYPVRLDIEAYNDSSLMLGHLMMVGTPTPPKIQVGLQ